MGTGVSPKRIATRNVIRSFYGTDNLSLCPSRVLPYLKSAPLLFGRFKPSHVSFLFQMIQQTSLLPHFYSPEPRSVLDD